jgi:ABC-2 type transport system permease protein
VDSIKRLVQLWGISAKLDLLWFLRDTKYCIITIIADIAASLSSVAGIFLLAERFGNIGGMSKDQVLFMLGYASIVNGIIALFFSMNNTGWISRPVGRGQMDHKLIQPVPLWMQLLTEGFIPVSGNSLLVCGMAITGYAAGQLGLAPGLLWILLFVMLTICSVAIILGCSYIAGSLAFYAPVAAEEISTTVISLFNDLMIFPIGGLSAVLRMALCTVVPVGLAAWFPASLLLGQNGVPKPDIPGVIILIMTITVAMLAVTSFRKGMKYYAKRGSTRYHNRGHRS